MLSQPHADKLCHLPLKLKRTPGCVIQIQQRTAEMLGKPVTKFSAKGGFEQSMCFRRTGIKSSCKAEKLYTLEMAVEQRTFRQAKVDRHRNRHI